MQQCLVSIIIPVYGVEKYIEKCARTILEQTYDNLEIIFVDDCSPDNSIQKLKTVLDEYPHRKSKTTILKYDVNRGLAGARKYGLEHAHGTYVLQVDSDDYIDPNIVETMVKAATAEDSDIVICDLVFIFKDRIEHRKSNPSLIPIECMKQILTGKVHGSVCNKLIRRELYTNNNIYPIEGIDMLEDLVVTYRLMYFATKISYVSQPLYFYELHEGSISYSRMNKKQQQNVLDVIRQMKRFIIEEGIKNQSLLSSFYNFFWFSYIRIIMFGDIKSIDESIFNKLKIKNCLFHPNMPISYKIIGLLKHCNIMFPIHIFRKTLLCLGIK